MNVQAGPARRLSMRGPTCRGLAIDRNGIALGPTMSLARRGRGGWRVVDAATLTRLDLGIPIDPGLLAGQIRGIARSLDEGDLVKAQILGLLTPLAALDAAPAVLRRESERLRKYSDDEPRIPAGDGKTSGEWTRVPFQETPKPGLLPRLAGKITAILRRELPRLPELAIGPAIVMGILDPDVAGEIRDGTIPGRDDLNFSWKEGDLTIWRTLPDGTKGQLFRGWPDKDGAYRTADGRIVAVNREDGLVVDVPTLEEGPKPAVNPNDPPADPLPAQDDDRPRLCPEPESDHPHGATARSIAYQEQISGLPPGLAVRLNGVVFDGCDESTGTMLEAKAAYEQFMTDPHKAFIWKKILNNDFVNQAKAQEEAANGRLIVWHFAEEAVADAVREKFKGRFPSIFVVYTPETWTSR